MWSIVEESVISLSLMKVARWAPCRSERDKFVNEEIGDDFACVNDGVDVYGYANVCDEREAADVIAAVGAAAVAVNDEVCC